MLIVFAYTEIHADAEIEPDVARDAHLAHDNPLDRFLRSTGRVGDIGNVASSINSLLVEVSAHYHIPGGPENPRFLVVARKMARVFAGKAFQLQVARRPRDVEEAYIQFALPDIFFTRIGQHAFCRRNVRLAHAVCRENPVTRRVTVEARGSRLVEIADACKPAFAAFQVRKGNGRAFYNAGKPPEHFRFCPARIQVFGRRPHPSRTAVQFQRQHMLPAGTISASVLPAGFSHVALHARRNKSFIFVIADKFICQRFPGVARLPEGAIHLQFVKIGMFTHPCDAIDGAHAHTLRHREGRKEQYVQHRFFHILSSTY